MSSRAIYFESVNHVGVVDTDLTEFGVGGDLESDDVLVELQVTGISPGTELRCLAGQQPGAPDFPFVPGYSGAGTVIETGSGAIEWLGRRVQCGGSSRVNVKTSWGGHQSHVLLKASGLNLIPDNVSFEQASLGRMLGIAHRGLMVSKPEPGQMVAIVGLGLIGQLSARWFSTSGAKVAAFDLSAERCAVAGVAGVEAHTLSKDGLTATIREIFEGGADIVVDATGSARVLPESIAAVRDLPWGEWVGAPKVVIQGSYPGDVVFNYQDAFRKELTLHMPRDTAQSDIRAGLDAISSGSFNVDGIIGELVSPEDANEAYRKLREEPNRSITYAVRWK